jgi:hypothetical protein
LQVAQRYKEEAEKNGYKAEIVKGSKVEEPLAYWSDEEVLGYLDKDKGYAVHIMSADGKEDKTVFFLSYSEQEIKKEQYLGRVELVDAMDEALYLAGFNKHITEPADEEKIDEAFFYASYKKILSSEALKDHFLSEYFWKAYYDKLKEMHEWSKKNPIALKRMSSEIVR